MASKKAIGQELLLYTGAVVEQKFNLSMHGQSEASANLRAYVQLKEWKSSSRHMVSIVDG